MTFEAGMELSRKRHSEWIPLASRRFGMQDQREFAGASGDWNPVHLDPAAARRSIFGEPVVHGLHMILWALDVYFGQAVRNQASADHLVCGISARFNRSVFLNQQLHLSICAADPIALQEKKQTRLVAHIADDIRVDIRLDHGEANDFSEIGTLVASCNESRTPVNLTFEEMTDRSGGFVEAGRREAARRLFPACTTALGAATVTELLILTRIVGMDCPGLNSIFSDFAVEIAPAAAESTRAGVAYKVENSDERFRLLQIGVSGHCLRGRLDALVRPAPVTQERIAAIANRIDANEFSGQHALIVGGSRGLGEATAKIIACGGGTPIITWYRGESDAMAIVEEIVTWGGKATALPFSVSAPSRSLTKLKQESPLLTHLYYFATPKIFSPRTKLFDHSVLRGFMDCYVRGFSRTCNACCKLTDNGLRVFYPSSTALDYPVRDLTEYTMAKAAGESLCAQMNRFDRRLTVLCPRLARIATDQTLSVEGAPANDAVDTMIPHVRRMQMPAVSAS